MRKGVYKLGDNVITSLGFTTGENYGAMLEGKCGIRAHAVSLKDRESLYVSRIDDEILEEKWDGINSGGSYTRFEKMAILSITGALRQCNVSPSAKDTFFILSTTKGNISLLDSSSSDEAVKSEIYLWESARRIASYFENPNRPLVISHACISGVSALIVARRMVQTGLYKNIVVCGADELSEFVMAGFQSLKALSSSACKPYDRDRNGLNLGEGAATMIVGSEREEESGTGIEIGEGVSTNDANHISGPSRTGEGLFRALDYVMKKVDISDLAFINLHGTATAYNDDMESIAVNRAGLTGIPASGFKGYIAHTLGAAGVIEAVLAVKSLENALLPGTLGFSAPGTSFPLTLSGRAIPLTKSVCIKTASGFGGCNAALLFKRVKYTG